MTGRKKILGIIAAFIAASLIPAGVLAAAPDETPADTAGTVQAEEASAGLRLAVQGGTLLYETASGITCVEQHSGIQTVPARAGMISVIPDDAYAFQKVLCNGETLSVFADADGSVTFDAPASGGSVIAICVQQAQTYFEIEGGGDVSFVEDGVKVPVYDGEAYDFSGEEAVTFEVAEMPDSSFAGAELNGDALDAEQTSEGWKFTVDTVPDGVVHVEFAPVLTVSSVLENCTLYMQQSGAWHEVAGGSVSLKEGEHPAFGVKADEGLALDALYINGTPVAAERNDEGMYVFEIDDAAEEQLVTAVCTASEDSITETDDDTGIVYSLPGRSEDPQSNITTGSYLDIKELVEGERYERASAACGRYGEVISAYDIALEDDGRIYEPTAPVTVSFPLPDGLVDVPDSELAIIRIGEGGSLSPVPFARAQIDGRDYLVGTSNHFCTFAVVHAEKKGPAEGASKPMGDETNLTLYLWLAIAAIAVVVLAAIMLLRRRKSSKK